MLNGAESHYTLLEVLDDNFGPSHSRRDLFMKCARAQMTCRAEGLLQARERELHCDRLRHCGYREKPRPRRGRRAVALGDASAHTDLFL